MRIRRAVAVLAAACGAVALFGTGTANAAPTLSSSAPLYTINADAYNISASGPIHYAPHLWANCLGFPSYSNKTFSLSIPGIGTVALPASACGVSDQDDSAFGFQSATGASLLGGKIVLGAVTSACYTDAAGNTTVGSTVAFLNGKAIGNTPLTISLPGIATVYLNKNSETYDPESGLTTLRSIAVQVVVPAKTATLLGHTYVISQAQTITLGECSISGYEGELG